MNGTTVVNLFTGFLNKSLTEQDKVWWDSFGAGTTRSNGSMASAKLIRYVGGIASAIVTALVL